MSSALGNVVSIYTFQERYAEAGDLSQRAIALGRGLNIPYLLCSYLHNEADRLLRAGYYDTAIPFSEEAQQIANKIGRKDVVFGATIASIRLQALAEESAPENAIEQLEALIEQWPNREEQARILYEIWRLDPRRTDAQKKAAALYQQLFTETPNFQHRSRYQTLTGQTLPEPPPLSEPPMTREVDSPSIESLLGEIDQVIAEL